MHGKKIKMQLEISFTSEAEVNVGKPIKSLENDIFKSYGVTVDTQSAEMERLDIFALEVVVYPWIEVPSYVTSLIEAIGVFPYVRSVSEILVEVYPLYKVVGTEPRIYKTTLGLGNEPIEVYKKKK